MAYRQSGWSAFTKETRMEGPRNTNKKKKKEQEDPTWEGTDEWRDPADIPASEYIERGLNPADYIPGYRKPMERAPKPNIKIPVKKARK
tara:strand:+ start:541 stop:807 length:267 start_codon:yes stop_codon:yes gene_type:complete